MKGDFSRDSFDPAKHFTRVLLQQGRVLTDADFNEQAAIQQHLLRAFVVDLVGRRWRVGDGFAIGGATAADFTIGAGRFYLGGIRFENADVCCYRTQPTGPAPADDGPGGGGDPGRAFVAYLEVWERSVSAAEDPSLLDPALGGADTSVRAQTVWQARRLSAAAARSLPRPWRRRWRRAWRPAMTPAGPRCRAQGRGCRVRGRSRQLPARRCAVRPARQRRAAADGADRARRDRRRCGGRLYGSGEPALSDRNTQRRRGRRRDLGGRGTITRPCYRRTERCPSSSARRRGSIGSRWRTASRSSSRLAAVTAPATTGPCRRASLRAACCGRSRPMARRRGIAAAGICRQRAALASVRKSGRTWKVTNYRPRR